MQYLIHAIITLCLVVGWHSFTSLPIAAQTTPALFQGQTGQVLVDEFNPQNTPIIELLVACLPPHDSFAQSTHYSLLSQAEVAQPDGRSSQFYSVQVYFKDAEGQLKRHTFPSLIELNSSGECISHIQGGSLSPLEQFIPIAIAAEFARSRFLFLQQHFPAEYKEMVGYFSAGGFTEPQPLHPSDNAGGCQILTSDAMALQQLGVPVSSSCMVVDSFVVPRGQ